MELLFLGTGGCRYCMIKQRRQTGGFILRDGDFMLAVDPGPGALVHGIRNGVDFGELDGIFVSHPHLDHEGDAEILIEGMTDGCKTDRGVLISNKDYLRSDNTSSSISTYHRQAVGEELIVEDGDEYIFENGIKLQFLEVDHKNVTTTGFKLTKNGKTFSYIPDTDMFDELPKKFEESDYMVVSCARPYSDSWKGHLGLYNVIELEEHIDPEKLFVTHLGTKFIENIDRESQIILDNGLEDTVEIAEDNKSYWLKLE